MPFHIQSDFFIPPKNGFKVQPFSKEVSQGEVLDVSLWYTAGDHSNNTIKGGQLKLIY